MTMMTDVAIIGAGPYGLSLGAHLAAANIRAKVFGLPMQFWRTCMPEGMVLKSEGFASNLWDPNGALTLKEYCSQQGLPYQDSGLPVPLKTFCDYGRDFQRRFVPNLDERMVERLDYSGKVFLLRLQDGEAVLAKRVVLATGIGSFRYTPPELDAISGPFCSHSIDHRSLNRFAGRDVLIIGGGASGVELAGLISQQGGRVTVATRQDRIPFCGPPRERSLWEKIQAPETGLGSGWRSLACVMAPMVFYRMPQSFRHMVVRKHLGPAPGWTSRAEVERNVRVVLGATLLNARIDGNRATVGFVMNDETQQTLEADHVIAATGFQVDMQRLGFLSALVHERLKLAARTPVLSPHFETSVPGLFAIGVTAANNFGPLLRFAYGAGFASRRLADFLARTARQHRVSAPAELAPV